jgi:hypothetical protein
LGCVGSPAPDAALCRDVIHRLCRTPRCAVVDAAFPYGDACEESLQVRSGCAAEDFTFTSPTRDRVLECRLPLVRVGTGVEQKPVCDDVAEALERCGDVTQFLNEGAK